jgi:pyruvate/2-oxoglutarate dehydrogenase complex dihydrolipoamide dehydrogenase (E3) component
VVAPWRVGTKITSVESNGQGVRVHTSGGAVDAESLLIAAGRRANTDTLDLDDAGVAYNENGLRLDKYLRTNIHNIWGVGDVTGAPRFTHVADYQARLVLRNALFPLKSAADYSVVPWAIYTHPEIAHVGLTEKQARDRHGDSIQVWRKSFVELDRAIADGQTNGLVKIITDKRGHILGGHILGTHASSMIAEIALAMKRSIRLADLASVIHAYPTYPESVKHTADAFVRSRFRGIAKRAAGWLVRH